MKYVYGKDVWPAIAELLHLQDMKVSGEVVIHIKVGDIVRVDITGLLCEQPINTTTVADEFVSLAEQA